MSPPLGKALALADHDVWYLQQFPCREHQQRHRQMAGPYTKAQCES